MRGRSVEESCSHNLGLSGLESALPREEEKLLAVAPICSVPFSSTQV